jgi:hypothetical protein
MIDKINRSRRDHIATIEEIIPGSALHAGVEVAARVEVLALRGVPFGQDRHDGLEVAHASASGRRSP